MTQDDDPRAAVVLLCEPGEFEWMAVLLVASLRAFSYSDISIHAYCRAGLVDDLLPETLAALEGASVSLDTIAPAFQALYPQGNKIYAAAAERAVPRTVFLDTDVILCAPFYAQDLFRPGHVSGTQTASWMWGRDTADWAPIYGYFDLMPGPQRIYAWGKPGLKLVPPSLNAALLAWDQPDFGSLWLDTALQIDRAGIVADPYPSLDQIALPIAAARGNLGLNFLTDPWYRKPAGPPAQLGAARFVHYHSRKKLLESPALDLADRLMAEFTAYPNLAAALAHYDAHATFRPEVKYSPGYKAARRIYDPEKP